VNSVLWSSSKAIWSFGGIAFVLLCISCIYYYAPQLATIEATATTPSSITLASSTLELRLLNGKVSLSGMLPDQSAKNQVLARAKRIFGEGNFTERLQVNNQTAFPSADWFNAALALMPFVAQIGGEGVVTLESQTVTIRGLVESSDIKSRLMSEAINAAGKRIRVEDKILVMGIAKRAK